LSPAGTARRVLFFLVLLALLFPSDALAYLDPGTGSLFVQTIIATLAATAYGVRLYWGRIQMLLRRAVSRGHSKPADAGAPPGGDTVDSKR
jgi:hypothetical protein